MGNNNDISMNDSLLSNGLFSKTRQAVLAFLYSRVDTSFYTKQVLDAVKIGRGTVQRELKNLTDAGIIIREVQGRQVYYRANEHCPIFNELKGIVRKTFGVADDER
jgi:DNA-binding transcriptional ArsR family regulator